MIGRADRVLGRADHGNDAVARRSGIADYGRAGFMLFAIAAASAGASLTVAGGTLPAAVLVIGGAGCLIGGVFLVALAKSPSLRDTAAGLLFAQPTVSICQYAADLGVRGDACFVPGGHGVRQFIPASGGTRPPGEPREGTFSLGDGSRGVWLVPSSAPLLDGLARDCGLVIPGEEGEILEAIREIAIDVLEIADRATAERSGEGICVTLSGFRLIDGCRRVRAASPKCCTMNPCPICSLFACMLATGLSRTVAIDRVSVEYGVRAIRLWLSYPPP